MRILVKNVTKESSEEEFIKAVLDSLIESDSGNERIYEAEGRTLLERSNGDLLEWTVAFVKWNGVADKMEVKLTC